MTALLPLPEQDTGMRYTPGQRNSIATSYTSELPVMVLAQPSEDNVIVQFLADDLDLDVLTGEVALVSSLLLVHG